MSLDFGFTAADKQLVGGSRYADPLGFGPIWTNIARRLVPNLTGQSTRAEGFELLLCGVDLYERYVEDYRGSPPEFRDFYIVLEQAFAHSTYRQREHQGKELRDRWVLPGSRAVRAASGHVKIGLGHQLLDAQFSGGTWGLYASAAERSGLITTDPPRLSDQVRDVVRNGYRSPTFIHEELDGLFRGIRRGFGDGHAISRATWTKYLARILEKLPHRELLREKLIDRPAYRTPVGYPQAHTELLAEVARRLRALGPQASPETSPFRQLVQRCADEDWDRQRFGDAKQIFTQIVVAESFLAPIADLFDTLFDHHGKTVGKTADSLDLPMRDLAAAHERFREVPYWSATARVRAALYGRLDCSSPVKLIESVVAVHGDVARARGRSPWLLLEEGKLIALIELDAPQRPDFSPDSSWRNSYYLSALWTLAEDLDVN